ncbi:CPBP family intramembrane glutamic endopeptidase [Lacinutrix sp. Bg11-31]|uniref:CPBP family intramembrane glutamic endopeptidase n=1 Tax=Lacinutrix sp. Bg11-31 TaxID=2057808 RepID=UPI000C3128ED|nr:CPBP family intramembrane glutamic endopeptidase [Lacinutrix sp. Bg11-31]AUC81221.1 CPBP family intramembrane metalloprotease [Lacinutrix sp. Bg11-31]
MFQSIRYKLIEFFLIFIVTPISFTIDFPFWIKGIIALTGFVYIIYVLLKIQKNKFRIAKNINWSRFFRDTLIKLVGIAFITIALVYFLDKASLFKVLINKPLMWLVLLFVYSAFSVYPQELIFRTFYFQRYENLFQNKKLFIFINAVVFSLAHLFFRNTLVIALTFFGGLLFAFTYKKTKSTLLVSIEHAIYGCWLFTVGMGEMLGFPS